MVLNDRRSLCICGICMHDASAVRAVDGVAHVLMTSCQVSCWILRYVQP